MPSPPSPLPLLLLLSVRSLAFVSSVAVDAATAAAGDLEITGSGRRRCFGRGVGSESTNDNELAAGGHLRIGCSRRGAGSMGKAAHVV